MTAHDDLVRLGEAVEKSQRVYSAAILVGADVDHAFARALLAHVGDEERLDGIDPASIPAQRAAGWPDFHPEDYCHLCGRRNLSWWVASPLWDGALVEDVAPSGIVCPQCFVARFVAYGRGDPTWELRPDGQTTARNVDPDLRAAEIAWRNERREQHGSFPGDGDGWPVGDERMVLAHPSAGMRTHEWHTFGDAPSFDAAVANLRGSGYEQVIEVVVVRRTRIGEGE